MLMLFPWPDGLRMDVSGGQLGIRQDLTWAQYMALVGEYWEKTGRYPHHDVTTSHEHVTGVEMTWWGQLFGLAVRAMLEQGYLDLDGNLTPPVPFEPPPPEYPE